LGDGEGKPLKPAQTLRAMVALRDSNTDPTIKSLYEAAKPGTVKGRVARYFLDKEAASILILQSELGVPRSTLYGDINTFKFLGVIHDGPELKVGVRGANRRLLVLSEADPNRVSDARKFHLELTAKHSVVNDNLRQMVFPLVEKVIGSNRWMLGDAIPEPYFQKPFFEEHHYYNDDVRRVIYESLVAMGYNISR